MLRLIALRIALAIVAVAAVLPLQSSDREQRPMNVVQIPSMGLEIWTERTPEWITEIVYRGSKPVFTAQTPVKTYPPAVMSFVRFPGMAIKPGSLEDVASEAFSSAWENYAVPTEARQNEEIFPASYGEMVGFESSFPGFARGDPVDIKAFVGRVEGQGTIMMQVYTLRGKLPHISESIRRSWTNIRYLKKDEL
ncbi:MAG: hypothetical protein AAF542_16460 [Pseudomonadota bacterium]